MGRAGVALCLGLLQDQCEMPGGLTLLILINNKKLQSNEIKIIPESS